MNGGGGGGAGLLRIFQADGGSDKRVNENPAVRFKPVRGIYWGLI